MRLLEGEKVHQTKDWFDNVVVFLLSVYYATTFIWSYVAWGRFVFVGFALLIFFVYVVKNGGIIKFRFYPLYGCIFLFATYALLSSIWAWEPSLSLEKAQSLFELFFITVLMSLYVYKHLSIDDSLNILLWGGIIVAVYSLMYYGLNGLVYLLSSGVRMETEFENVNSLSICWVISAVVALYKALHQHRIWLWFVIVGMVMLIAAAESRKAFICLVIGVIMVMFVRFKGKNTLQTSFRFVLLGVVLLTAVYFLLQSFVFSGILGRMEGFWDFFRGESYRGHAESRYRYIQIGIEQWKKTPLFGIGIANSPSLLVAAGEGRTYLHNNYVELLACCGVLGFILFYVKYLQLIKECVKGIRKGRNNELAWLILTITLLLLLLDYGTVSYSTKQHYIQVMLLYAFVYARKDESVRLIDDSEQGKPCID